MGQKPSIGQRPIRVRVKPKASKSEIVGYNGDALEIRIAASPVKGEANTALIDILARALNVRKVDVAIVSGARSRNKMVSINGLSEDQVKDILCRASE